MKPYIHYFDSKLNTESVNGLISTLHDKEKIELWFSTRGGDVSATRVLLSFLNSRHKDIEIVITCQLASAGTKLLIDFKGKIRFDNVSYILFHVIDRERYPLRKCDTFDDDLLQKQDWESNLVFAEKIKQKGLLNEKQIKQFLRGRDVVIYSDSINKWKL